MAWLFLALRRGIVADPSLLDVRRSLNARIAHRRQPELCRIAHLATHVTACPPPSL